MGHLGSYADFTFYLFLIKQSTLWNLDFSPLCGKSTEVQSSGIHRILSLYQLFGPEERSVSAKGKFSKL